MKILITGGSGFVGRAFFRHPGFADNDWTNVDLAEGCDARDFFRTDSTKFDLVIHLAAVVGGRETIENSPLKVAVDLAIDADLFQWALRTKPKKLVYFSSSAAYPVELQGLFSHLPLWEDAIDLNNIQSPDMTYGFAKLAGEYQAKFLAEAGVSTLVFRPFSGYGTDQDLCYPFPTFIMRAKAGQSPFQVWGNGRAMRDFIHIEDVVRAVMVAVENDMEGTFNLGTGRATSFDTLAKMVMKECGYFADIEHIQAKPAGVMARVADVTKMSSFYTPRVSLEEGIRAALANQHCPHSI
jgi:nucleoside-diphosphate-sugar epimerase